jgi:hypothetical protein
MAPGLFLVFGRAHRRADARVIAAGRSHLSRFVTRHRGFSRSDSRKRAGSAEKAKDDFEAAA